MTYKMHEKTKDIVCPHSVGVGPFTRWTG